MADFRRWFLAFAALVLVLGSAVPASAQAVGPQVTCTVSSTVTPTLRSEGLTELVGDILLVCTGVPGSSPTPKGKYDAQADITVSFPALLSTSTVGSAGGLDALLLVDDPSVGNQTVCPTPTDAAGCINYGDGGQTFNQTGKYNVFQGVLGGPAGPTHSITFLGVPVDPPGSAAGGQLTYRITNVRIQAPSVPGSAGLSLTPVFAFVSTSSSTSITISSNSQQTVGYVYPGLTFSATGTNPPFLQCLSYTATPVGALTFAENFPNSFKVKGADQTTPGLVYYSESGLNVAIPSGGTTGVANTPTELEAVISNVPAGVQVWVDATDTDAQGISANLVSPSTAYSGTVKVLDTSKSADTAVGSVTVVWAVNTANAAAFPASLVFNVYVTFSGAPGAGGGSPATGVTAYAQGGFAPQVSGWVNGGPVPEFVIGLSPAAPGVALFQVSLCQTILLFPYVTDFYGFDTGLAISNTSLDNLPVGAAPQTGTCSVNFYGDGGVAKTLGTSGVYSSVSDTTLTKGEIAPGQTWAFSLSGIDSGYESTSTYGTTGYAIATCDFQYAHGYSFVSDTGIRNFAAAYLALIIPDAPREPRPFVCAGAASCTGQPGEQLVH